MKNNAFTLAEVLITLGIIGVVAAMTLPAVINNKRNKELETGLKKAYSVLGQALDMYQAENGERMSINNTDTHEVKSQLLQYFKDSIDCGLGYSDADEACIPNYSNNDYDSDIYKNFTGTKIVDLTYFDDGQFILADETLILLENYASRIYISADVNGVNKRPNRLGQDLFMFQLDKNGILRPMGASGTDYYSEQDKYCSTSSTAQMNGAGCTYKALTEKDYFKNLP